MTIASQAILSRDQTPARRGDAAADRGRPARYTVWGFLDHARSGIDGSSRQVQATPDRLTGRHNKENPKGGDRDLAKSSESGARSDTRCTAGPLPDRPVRMLDCPLHDLEGRLLGDAGTNRRHLPERHMELLAMLRPCQQARENHQLDHPAHSSRSDQRVSHATRSRRRLKAGVE
jgi:hypothetical protein